MKDRAPEQECVSWLTIGFGLIVGIIMLALGLYGNNIKSKSIARCTGTKYYLYKIPVVKFSNNIEEYVVKNMLIAIGEYKKT